MPHWNEKKAEAERKITEILVQLEADTGIVIEDIELLQMEVTLIGDEHRTFIQKAAVRFRVNEARRWDITQ